MRQPPTRVVVNAFPPGLPLRLFDRLKANVLPAADRMKPAAA